MSLSSGRKVFAAAFSGALVCQTGNLSTALQLAGWILVNTLVFTACAPFKVLIGKD